MKNIIEFVIYLVIFIGTTLIVYNYKVNNIQPDNMTLLIMIPAWMYIIKKIK